MVMPLYFMVVGLALQPLGEIFPGLAALIREPDFLITDYFVIGGVGAAFMNAGLLTMLLLWLLYKMGVEVVGKTVGGNGIFKRGCQRRLPHHRCESRWPVFSG